MTDQQIRNRIEVKKTQRAINAIMRKHTGNTQESRDRAWTLTREIKDLQRKLKSSTRDIDPEHCLTSVLGF